MEAGRPPGPLFKEADTSRKIEHVLNKLVPLTLNLKA